MTALPAEITYGTVTGRFIVAVSDGPDADNRPDRRFPSGRVGFTPKPVRVAVGGAIMLPDPIIVDIPAGGDGTFSVELIATDNPNLNPTDWTYEVAVALTGRAPWKFNIEVPAGTTQNLADLAPVASANGVPIVRGEKGDPADSTGVAAGYMLVADGAGGTDWVSQSGTSVTRIVGSIPTQGDLPSVGEQRGDAYFVEATSHLWVWAVSEGWIDFGTVAQGPKGDTGPAGSDGASGADGAPGPKGDKGDKGDTGPAGSDGASGADGAPGPKGDKGDKGDTGPAGSDGASGADGAPGPKGDEGDKGDKGNTGPAGSDGAQGPKGDTGPAGSDGAQGPKGDPGSDATVTDATVATALEGSLSSAQIASQVTARALTRVEAPVSVMAHSPAADGTTDDTSALNAAADEARAGQSLMFGSRGVYVPADMTLYINGTVDLRYIIDVKIEGRLRMGPSGLVIIGHSSNQRPGQRIRIREARWVSGAQSNVCVRAVGLVQANVEIGYCSSLELLADSTTDAVNNTSIGYNTFTLGRVIDLHLKGVGAMGWVNENKFLGGDIENTTLSGPYRHNNNTWIEPSLELGTIDVQVGDQNRWIGVRGEGGTVVNFGAGTFRNVVEDGYTPHSATRSPTVVLGTDLGHDNVVTSLADRYLTPVEVATLDRNTLAFDGATEVAAGKGIVPGLDMVKSVADWDYVLDTGIFPLTENVTTYGAVSAYEQQWRLRRFLIASDTAWFVPNVWLYDANGNVLNTGLDLSGGWAFSTDHWQFWNNNRAATVYINSTTATHARIGVRNDDNKQAFTYLRLTAFYQEPSLPAGVEIIRRQMRRPLYQAAQPTQGLAHPGTVVQGPAASWRSVARVDTTTTAAAASGATTITVATATGMVAGDVIGVLMTTRMTHWTTIASLSGTTVTLTTAPTAAVASGAAVGTTRWTARADA